MQRLRLIGLGLATLVAFFAWKALGQDVHGDRLSGWTYSVSAPPLAAAYADPGGRLSDGEHGRDHTAIW